MWSKDGRTIQRFWQIPARQLSQHLPLLYINIEMSLTWIAVYFDIISCSIFFESLGEKQNKSKG